MKVMTVGLITLSACLYSAVAGAAGENWKLLSNDEQNKIKYYYDTKSVKKSKAGRFTVMTKTEGEKGGAQRLQLEIDCDKDRYRYINPNHEWQPALHGTPSAALKFNVCK